MPGTSAPPISTSTATASAGGTPTPELSVEPGDFEIGPGPFFLDDPRVGLGQLTGYSETLTVTFRGTVDGQPSDWTRRYRFQHTSQPSAAVLTVEVTGDAQAPDPIALAEAGGATYEVAGDGTCTGRPMIPGAPSTIVNEPAALLPALLGADEAGSEPVNGVATNHYTFDGRALLEAGGPVTNGELWVASDVGYVVRFLRTTNADAGYFGDGLAGEMAWDYELTDVNALASVTLPAGCQMDAPVMGDAANLLVLPEYLGFDTGSSVADAIQFYQDHLPAEGWSLSGETSVTTDTAVADFAKGDQVLHVIVTTGDGATHVDVALTGAG